MKKTCAREENEESKLKTLVYKHINILRWLPTYTKFDGISDLVAGITVGLTMMPQSIAYASLADIPAQYGLYTAFVGSFIYIFFGTIKEVSIGPTSLLALLTLSYTEGLPLEYVVLLSFCSGCVELLLGLLKLGFLVDFISAPVTTAFTSATSVIIMTSQLKGLLGLKFKSHGMLEIYHYIATHLSEIKTADAVLGFSSIVFLLIFRQIGKLKLRNKRLEKVFWFLGISKNALLVLICSTIAFFIHKSYGRTPFRLSGTVPAGMPSFKLPKFSTTSGNDTVPFLKMIETLGSGVFVVPVVAVFQNVAIAKAFATGSIVDATQEMMTLGIANILGSFVQAMPATGAFTRSAVNNASGVRTPLSGLYAASIIVLALSFLTPYFYYIPKSTLSAVLITAVVFMINYEIVPKLWRCNKFDLTLHIMTFFLCIFYGVEMGLFIGVMFNVFGLLKLWLRPRIHVAKHVDINNEEFLVVKPELGLYFPAVDYFTEEVVKQSLITTSPIAVDFENVLRIDYSGCQAISNLIQIFNKKNRQLIFLHLNQDVYRRIETLIDVSKLRILDGVQELSENNCLNVKPMKSDDEKPLLAKSFYQTDERRSSLNHNV